MDSTIIIGFGHRARSGKDTAAAAILNQRGAKRRCDLPYVPGEPTTGCVGTDIRRYGFGDALKMEVNQAALSAGGMQQLFGTWEFYRADGAFVELPQWVLEGYELNPDMSDPKCFLGKQRTLLQWWGTEFRRSVNPNYWVDKLKETVEKDKPEVALIADVRFTNEFDWVKSVGEVVRVDRPSLPPLTAESHASERGLAHIPDEEWSRVLVNDGTLEEFQAKAVEMFDVFMEYPKGYGFGI